MTHRGPNVIHNGSQARPPVVQKQDPWRVSKVTHRGSHFSFFLRRGVFCDLPWVTFFYFLFLKQRSIFRDFTFSVRI
jgi:hypothetical protein